MKHSFFASVACLALWMAAACALEHRRDHPSDPFGVAYGTDGGTNAATNTATNAPLVMMIGQWTKATTNAGGAQFYVGALVHGTSMFLLGSGVYSTSNGSNWTTVSAQNFDSASASFNGYLWNLTGQTVWRSANGATWNAVTTTAPWSARRYPAVVVLGAYLYSIGGQSTSDWQWSSETWRSADGINWVRMSSGYTNGNDNVMGASACVFSNKIFVSSGISYPKIWSTLDGSNWSQVSAAPPFNGRQNGSLVAYKGALWLVAGCRDGSTVYNDVWYSVNGVNWTQRDANAPFSERYGHGACVFNDAMWIIDGTGYGGNKADAWYLLVTNL